MQRSFQEGLRPPPGESEERQRGSHMTLTRTDGDESHSVTVPRHRALRVGTLGGIVGDVAEHLGVTQDEVRRELFGS